MSAFAILSVAKNLLKKVVDFYRSLVYNTIVVDKKDDSAPSSKHVGNLDGPSTES